MDTLLSGNSKTLIEIKNEHFDLFINGQPFSKKSHAINANENIQGYININNNELEHLDIKSINSFGELEDNNTNTMFPAFFENNIYEILIKAKDGKEYEVYHKSGAIRNRFRTIGDVTFGSFSFKDEIGYSTFEILNNGVKYLSITIEVFPSKMDYMSDYKKIMEDVNNHITSLAFEFLGNTFEKGGLKDVHNQTGIEFLSILDKVHKDLNKAIKRVIKHPKHNVQAIENIKNLERCKRVSRKTTDYIRKNPSILKKHERGFVKINGANYIPTKVIENRKITTIDIFENRYVKFIIQKLLKRIKEIKNRFGDRANPENYYYNEINKIQKSLEQHLNGFFKDIGDVKGNQSMTLVFQMAAGYREVYYYYNILKKGLDICEDIYEITPKKIWKLYEIWCYIKIHHILKELGYDVVHNGIIKAKDNGLTLTLIQNKEAYCTYKKQDGKDIELWYNKKYSYLPTASQKPDTVLCLKNGKEDDRIFIFDAKYRLSVGEDGIVGPMEEDINVMHRYRDAIVSEMGEEKQFKYKTFGAYVMFPYSDEKKFLKNKFYESIEKVNIGAFPMLPESTSLITKHLSSILEESKIEAKSKLPTYEDSELNNNIKFKMKNVMVVNIKDREHLEAYKNHKFFHIPKSSLSKVKLNVEYIAFYAPKNKFHEECGIKYYGKIKDIYTYKREDCSFLPLNGENNKKANEEYLRFELEEIKNIKNNINTVEYGTRLVSYTTLYLLLNAETVHELSFSSDREIELYRDLKKKSVESGQVIRKKGSAYFLGDVEYRV